MRLLRGRKGLSVLWVLAMGGVIVAVSPSRVAAQVNTQRESIVDQLLRSLIESELEKRQNARAATRIPDPAPTSLSGGAPDVRQTQQILADVAQEANRLTNTLNAEQNRNPAIRPLMNDVLQARARATVLAQQSSRNVDPQQLQIDLKELDRTWRLIAYRLGRIPNLSTEARGSIAKLNQYEQQLRDLFKVTPQVDHRGLFQQTASLSSSLSHLLEDIEIELDQAADLNKLLIEGRRVEQQARQLLNLVADEEPYDVLVKQFQKFQEQWYPFAGRLRPFENRYIERSVRRVSSIENGMHETLLLPRRLDRQQLVHLTGVLQKDVNTFFTRAPLKLLIELPNPELVLSTADEFYGVCDNFIDCVQRGEEGQNLIGCFQYIEEGWQSFNRVFRPIKSDAAQHVLTEIEQSIYALRQELQLQEPFDRRLAADLAAALENLSETLDADTQAWLSKDRPSFRAQAMRDSAAFAAATHRFHESILAGASPNQLRTEISELYDQWRRVYSYISQCQTSDRAHLGRMASRITPTLVELRTMFAL